MTVAEQTLREIDQDIEARVDRIWLYVREKRHSLDAEIARRSIRAAIDAATEAVVVKVEPLFTEIDELKAEIVSLKNEIKKGKR
jgi:polyhydroxyalkanoate synthesis regulator phasin